jgi:hypothetical protein
MLLFRSFRWDEGPAERGVRLDLPASACVAVAIAVAVAVAARVFQRRRRSIDVILR